jgi:hypothetical protein
MMGYGNTGSCIPKGVIFFSLRNKKVKVSFRKGETLSWSNPIAKNYEIMHADTKYCTLQFYYSQRAVQ